MNESQPVEPPTKNGGYEKSDANVGSLTKLGLGLVGLTVVVFLVMFGILKLLQQGAEKSQAPRHPLAEATQLPPEPRLQKEPEIDLEKFRAREDSLLNSYGWVVNEAGVVRIPVDSAMALVAKRGLPVRPKSEERGAKSEERP
jgi:hypothetical protein